LERNELTLNVMGSGIATSKATLSVMIFYFTIEQLDIYYECQLQKIYGSVILYYYKCYNRLCVFRL